MGLVVFKLGGSLLASDRWPDRLRGLLRQRREDRVLIIIGGGAAADIVREWSRLYVLAEATAHSVALRSISLTRCLVKSLLPECAEVASMDQAQRHWSTSSSPLLLDVEKYLEHAEPGDVDPLPHTWDVTSDSIAAWIASRWSADELVLLKSTGLESGIDLNLAVERGLVDAHFPVVAAGISQIRWCNLQDDSPRIQLWLSFGPLLSGRSRGPQSSS